MRSKTEEPATPHRSEKDASGTRPSPNDTRRRGKKAPRLWSDRRIPATLIALVTLCVSGALLYDVIAVRAGHRAWAWRTHLAQEMATRPVDDLWMLVGSSLAVVLGLWLLILAATPGRRRLLPLRAPADCADTQAWLDRRGAELLLRDAAMRVPGVGSARATVGRRRLTVHAYVSFRDPGTVRDDLTRTLHDQCRLLALAHTPRLTVRARHHTR
ncbi:MULTISPECIES: DUF6286 domain-containing protein [unclassified Streptomyces]|uniref:DUF6286 domain-containing protein n=1 Tax=unclassified Streptomyces TaxID=2593676 RepID=UPI00381380EA